MIEIYKFEKYGVSISVFEKAVDGKMSYILNEYVDDELMDSDEYQNRDKALRIARLRAGSFLGIDPKDGREW